MVVRIVDQHLEVAASETDSAKRKREALALPYAVMRSGVHGGDGTKLTAVDKSRTKVEPANGELAKVKLAMEADYDLAMEKLVVFYGKEIDVRDMLP